MMTGRTDISFPNAEQFSSGVFYFYFYYFADVCPRVEEG
jgi:hypothetical protein